MKERYGRGKSRRGGDPPPTSPRRRIYALQSTPKKSLGQNFLVDEQVVGRILQEVCADANETVVEIGPGRGALTSRLVENAGRLLAVEFDRDLITLLNDKFGAHENFTLIEGDALEVDLCAIIAPSKQARVVGNLPFNISTAILRRLIEHRACLTEFVLMLQREVADRITAQPGSGDRGYLSVLVEAYCETERLFDVPPTSFRPVPKVWSTVVRLNVREQMAVTVADEGLLWRIVSAGFAQRRKTIMNNLRSAPADIGLLLERAGGAGVALERAEIEARRRAETLTLEEWGRLTRVLEAL